MAILLHQRSTNLLVALRGKILHIPNLKTQFTNWPGDINRNLDKARILVDKMIESVITDKQKLSAYKGCDFGFLASTCFPYAAWPDLEIAAGLLLWIFIWDDGIDHGEVGNEIASSSELAHAYCDQSINYVKSALGLDRVGCKALQCSIPVMKLFGESSSLLPGKLDRGQLRRLFRELSHFIRQVQVEQSQQENDIVPTPEQYTLQRLGTVGVIPFFVVCEFTSNVRLPDWIMESTEMKLMWNEIAKLCMLINDIYSVQKELKSGAFQNIIPILFSAGERNGDQDLKPVTTEYLTILHQSMQNFESLYAHLKEQTSLNKALQQDLEKYVSHCRAIPTGMINWSLATRRYKIEQHLQSDGSALVPL